MSVTKIRVQGALKTVKRGTIGASAGVAVFIPPVQAGTRTVPLIGRSGLPWNSLVFGHPFDQTGFETWRGRQVDGILYFPARNTWADLHALPPRPAGGNGLMLYTIPFAPMGQGITNAQVGAGNYDTQIRNFARQLINNGWNTERVVLRPGWESNGSWYEWAWPNSTIPAFISAFRRFVQQCRLEGLTNVRWCFNLNKENQPPYVATDWTTAYPGDDVVDVIGLDPYDHWGPAFNESDWTREVNRNPGLANVAMFARGHGKQMGIDEWGVSHYADGAGGGDNPFYIEKIWQFCQANADILAWETTFDDIGAPADLLHKLSAGDNPLAAAAYKASNRWGGPA